MGRKREENVLVCAPHSVAMESPHCLGGVVLSGRDGAGCTNHIPQYHTLTHTVTNAVKVWKCGERSRVHVRSVPAREIGARCHIQTTR